MLDQITFYHFIPYIFLVLLCWVCSYYKTRYDLGIKVVLWGLLLFSALRYNVGWDYGNYTDAIEGRLTDDKVERFEWLSKWLIYFSRYTFTQLFFIVNSVIVFVCLREIVLKYSVNPALSVFLFFTFSIFYLQSLTIVRNFTAVLMVMYACTLFIDKKKLFFLIVVAVSSGIHSSAYIGFLIPLIYWLKGGRKFNIIMLLCSLLVDTIVQGLVMSFSANPMWGVLSYYLKFADQYSEGNIYKYLIYVIDAVFLIYWNRLVRVNKHNLFFLNLMNFGTCIWTIFSFQSIFGFRLSLFFIVWLIILFPALIYTFDLKYRALVKQTVMISFTILFFLNLYLLANSYNNGLIEQASFLPYKTIFLKD
ncbi:EpsG family protein [Bacteroides hominis]|uniref:EpsG family protein n=1 Tax=Bacteroides TaxID=816 RepID=UPI000C782B40|nr:EpsG family protein [Bacteroides fragilis]AUI47733.1 hypothetical protein BUN20_14955 [Bacteroides fragilis]MCZ2662527.1 EpsG family protein [Bacteroides fragilis]